MSETVSQFIHRHTLQRCKDLIRHGTFKARSPHFHTLCKKLESLSEYRGCLACGSKDEVEWHHWQVEFHKDPSRECDPTNLVPLCMKRRKGGTPYAHHFDIGHDKSWKVLNPRVKEDAAVARASISYLQSLDRIESAEWKAKQL